MCQVFVLYFAFLSALASTLALSICVVYVKILLSGLSDGIHNLMIMSKSDSDILSRMYISNILFAMRGCIVYLIGCLMSLICFVFSQILYYGIKNNRSGLLKTYLEFGSLLTMLVTTCTVCHMIYEGGMPGGYVLIACVVYACILGVIQVIYKSMVDKPVLSSVTSE